MKNSIPEELLHYAWRVKCFNHSNLKTTSGDQLEILKFGDYNTDAGPDFLNASIKINDIIWAGHVEMHVNSSDWLRHDHSSDPAYNNVILHVVLEEDAIIQIVDKPIPCLVLKERIDSNLLSKFALIRNTSAWVPCEPLISTVNEITKTSTIHRMIAERLEHKAHDILTLHEANNGDLLETIYQRLGWSFGLKVNAGVFLHLCQKTPYKYIGKHADSLFQIEALLFGQSGLLPKEADPYVQSLQKEYTFLKSKFSLTSVKKVEWKFMRMRPSGFPTIRIAQFAKLLHNVGRLDRLLFEEDIHTLKNTLSIKLDSGYWMSHYTFKETSKDRSKSIGADKLNSIVINAVAPLLFTYGLLKSSDTHKEKAIELLESIPAERNAILSKWKDLGMPNNNASDSQGLLQLKKHYCDISRCLECSIGHQILRQ